MIDEKKIACSNHRQVINYCETIWAADRMPYVEDGVSGQIRVFVENPKTGYMSLYHEADEAGRETAAYIAKKADLGDDYSTHYDIVPDAVWAAIEAAGHVRFERVKK